MGSWNDDKWASNLNWRRPWFKLKKKSYVATFYDLINTHLPQLDRPDCWI
ncbi:hypothetical protein Fmac_028020 [Flemingia macrophylla]|uniref:Uncharacterized protein n=1 Tax=Flemingia macrophylla TaxID=520843 RepID=A0ABD1LJI2_9FABA